MKRNIVTPDHALLLTVNENAIVAPLVGEQGGGQSVPRTYQHQHDQGG